MRIASHRRISIMEREYGGNELKNQPLPYADRIELKKRWP